MRVSWFHFNETNKEHIAYRAAKISTMGVKRRAQAEKFLPNKNDVLNSVLEFIFLKVSVRKLRQVDFCESVASLST